MLTKALIAALVAFAFAVVSPAAGAATVKPGKAQNAAASAAKAPCLKLILANEDGVDPDPDSDSDTDTDRDSDSDSDSGRDTDSGAPDPAEPGESDPGPYEPPTSDPDELPGPGECLP